MPRRSGRISFCLLSLLLCGSSLMAAFCTQCGRKIQPEAKFCPACGAKVKVEITPLVIKTEPVVEKPVPVTPKPPEPVKPPKHYQAIAEATRLFDEAEALRQNMNPFSKKSNYKKATKLYKEIIAQYPDSDRFEASHYQLGNINESVYYNQYTKAVSYYEKVLEINPATTSSARYRLADINLKQLNERKKALYWYRQALKNGGNELQRLEAEGAVKELEKEFGKEVLKPAAPVQPEPATTQSVKRPASVTPARPIIIKRDVGEELIPLSPNRPVPGEDFTF